MKNLILLFALVVSTTSISAQLQEWCHMTPISNSSKSEHSFKNLSSCAPNTICNGSVNQFYQPDQNSNNDLKTIPVVIHVMQQATSNPQNFENISSHRNFIIDIIDKANQQGLQPGCPKYNSGGNCTGASFLSDTKIRLELDPNDIYFHVDAQAWSGGGSGSTVGCPGLSEYAFNEYGTEVDCKLNIFFINGGHFWDGCGPGYNGESTNFIAMDNSYVNYVNSSQSLWVKARNESNVLVHELGHCLGLGHTTSWFSCDQCTLFPDVDCPDAGGWCSTSGTNNNCSNNIMGAAVVDSRRYLSPLQIGQMHRLLLTTWRSKIIKQEYNTSKSITISTNQTWSYSKLIEGDITIKPGATLTIKCLILMPKSGKIKIERGGKLVVDGGKITTKHSSCSGRNMWKGIEVWGNANKAQTSSEQGTLILKNGAIIEYADNAISTSRNGWSSYAGGIIYAFNANFLNNKRSVEFLRYTYANNKSYFTNCTFKLNDDYPLNNFIAQATLWDVYGIPFTNCEFNNDISSMSNRQEGIYSISAGYDVLGSSTKFLGFRYGIYASGSGNTITVSLSNPLGSASVSNFSGNSVGVYTGGVNNISIRETEFRQVTSALYSNLNHGIFINGGTGYNIEKNSFIAFGSNNATNTIGVLAKNTGSSFNVINNNILRFHNFANLSNGNNKGLRYRCNENISNLEYDFNVTNDVSGAGIATFQGSSSQAAGNIFSRRSSPNGSDFFNAPYGVYYYYYNTNSQNPQNSVGIVKYTGSLNNCNSVTSLQRLSQNERQVYENEFTSTIASLRSQQNSLIRLIDGGNTEDVLTDIDRVSISSVESLKMMLRELSPFVSEEVVKKIASRSELFEVEFLEEVVLLNPDVLRNKDVMDILATFIDEAVLLGIMTSSTAITERTRLEQGISDLEVKAYTAGDILLRDLFRDEERIDYKRVRRLLRLKGDLQSAYQIVEILIKEGQLTEAMRSLNEIIELYDLDEEQQENFKAYQDWKAIEVVALNDDRNILEFTDSEVAALERIADRNAGLASIHIKGILNFAYGYDYIPETIYPNGEFNEGGTSNIIIDSDIDSRSLEVADELVSAYPNPANDQIIFDYKLLEDRQDDALLMVYNLDGKLVHQFRLSDSTGQIIWNLDDVSNGIYFYQVISAEVASQPKQFLVAKK